MGEAGLNRAAGAPRLAARGAALLLWLAAGAPAAATGPSRFASYGTDADCVAARAFPSAACRTAFANARAEYESKTPSFPSLALCARRYGSCMAWPPGVPARGGARFRPAWDGVDIVDTPSERSVTPAPGGAAGRTVRFAARSLDPEPAPLTIRGAAVPAPPPRRLPGTASPSRRFPGTASPSRPGPALAGAAARFPPPARTPPPGSGFTLEDGVLTYPAPARFQPQNLPKAR